jgi:hypothetical protein
MKMKRSFPLLVLLSVLSMISACAHQAAAPANVPQISVPELTPRGTMIFNDEYEFTPPPSQWEMLKGNESSHYVVGFYRKDSNKIQLESSFIAYDEEPFGSSRNLEIRARECLKLYFWASMLQKTILEKKKVHVLGGEGLAVTFEVKDPSKKIKVKSMLVFGYRGDRVVLFYCNQWRTLDGSYDTAAFDIFNKFVHSFTFLRKSFYETL